jgi:hypothetical protein
MLSREVEYLGFKLTQNGLEKQDKLVEAVKMFPVPKDVKSLKGFLGLVGFYRRFIQDFCGKAASLYKLLKKDTAFIWEKDQQDSFEALKKALTTSPVLALPDYQLPFKVVTDAACKTGVGGVLMQEYEEGWRPVAFISRSLTPAELNYSATEVECLVVVWCIKKFNISCTDDDSWWRPIIKR